MLNLAHPVVCIVGPTASGKTDVAQLVAREIDAEIISADSMQIYTGMNIGTGKIPEGERIVPHHGFDIVSPGEPYSVALFQDYARSCITSLDARHKRSVLCGGTGFYVKAVIDDYDFPEGEQDENPLRAKYERFAEEQGEEALWQLLFERDPESAHEIHPNNVRRVVRALELNEQGKSYAYQKAHLQRLDTYLPAVQFGLAVEPEILNARINARVDAMVEAGLVNEVKTLLDQGLRAGLTAPQAIGYKEIVQALEGECTLDEAIEAIKLATRRYGKRQRSWFRRDKRIKWVDANSGDTHAIARDILRHLNAIHESLF